MAIEDQVCCPLNESEISNLEAAKVSLSHWEGSDKNPVHRGRFRAQSLATCGNLMQHPDPCLWLHQLTLYVSRVKKTCEEAYGHFATAILARCFLLQLSRKCFFLSALECFQIQQCFRGPGTPWSPDRPLSSRRSSHRWWMTWKSTLQPLGHRNQGRHRKVICRCCLLAPLDV